MSGTGAGTGKRVVSYALFRHPASAYERPEAGNRRGKFFPAYLPLLVRAHQVVWPGWELRIYHDDSLYSSGYGAQLLRLERAGLLRLVYMGPPKTLCGSMLWRLAPLWDPEVEVVACRDIDSCPQPRDRAAVERFAATGKAVHVIHDCTSHAGVMGGTLGLRAALVRPRLGASLEAFLASIKQDLNQHGADQEVLRRRLAPDVVDRNLPRESDLDLSTIGAAMVIDPILERYRAIDHPGKAAIEAAEAAVPRMSLDAPRAVFSSDLNADYFFYLPLTAALWRHVAGYRPTVLLTGTCAEWRAHIQAAIALRHAREQGAEIHWIGPVAGHRSSTVAQVARLFAGALDEYEDSWLLTADVDMWPLSAWFREAGVVTLHYGNAYEHEPVPKWPLCYIGARASTWRQIMGLSVMGLAAGPLGSPIQRHLDERLAGADAWRAWNHDEVEFARRLTAWPGYPAQCAVVPRRGCPPVDRIDRSAWPAAPVAAGMVDAHLPRPGWVSWPLVRPLIAQAAPDLLPWADGYAEEFRRTC